jgi:hypothetical protein
MLIGNTENSTKSLFINTFTKYKSLIILIMKIKLLTLFVITSLLFPSKTNAQNYNYSKLNTTYANLTGNTTVSDLVYWDDFSIIPLKLPFTFKFFNVNQDSIYIVGGFASFHIHGTSYFGSDELYFFDVALMQRSIGGTSDISIATTGSAPNRIYKVQIQNAGLADDFGGAEADYVNAQLWLYETTNVIEVHCGQSSVASNTYAPLAGPTVGLYKNSSSYISLSGNASNPTSSTSSPSLDITGTPATSQVYKFTPTVSGIEEFDNTIMGYIYPNPSSGHVNFKAITNMSNATINIYNTLGELVFEQKNIFLTNNKNHEIDLDTTPGIYFVEITNGDKKSVQKLVIQ